jgi:hypothetical protein
MAKRVVLIDDVEGIVPLSNTGASNGNVLTYNSSTGINWAEGGGGGAASVCDFGGRFNGSPAANAVLFSMPMSRAGTVSTDDTKHQFFASAPPSSGSVVLTVYRLPYNSLTKVAIFTATWSSADAVFTNGLYKAAIGTVSGSNGTISAGDIVSVEMGGTANASFSTPQFNVNASLT